MELSTVTLWSTFTNELDLFCFSFLVGTVCGLLLALSKGIKWNG